MPESLSTPDGKTLELEQQAAQEFARAMAAPEPDAAPDYPPPRRRRNPDAPFGYEEDGATPKAPYGIGANGKPRQNRAGPGRGGKPRVQDAVKAARAELPARDYSKDLAETVDGLWAALAFLPPTQAQATILKGNKGGLVAGFNLSAQHNPIVRRGIEYWCSDGGWMINAAMLIAPFALQSAALWFRPESLAKMGTSKEELAEIAGKDFREFVAAQERALAELVEEARLAEEVAA